MAKSVTLTIRLPIELKESLEALADATDRSLGFLASQAIAEYVDVQRWQVQAIVDGMAAADRGEWTDLGEVRAAWEAKRARRPDEPRPH
jgi:RHH-type rel operon transcriptional repressor/antitoxin RelB